MGEIRSRFGDGLVRAVVGDNSIVWVDPRLAGHRPLGARLPDHGEMRFQQRVLRPGDLFCDVGANIGTYSLIAAESGAQVLAFEPQPRVSALLERNVDQNGRSHQIEVLRSAVGALAGTVSFTGGIGLMGHLITSEDALAASQAGAYTGRMDGVIDVPMTTLDDVVGDRSVVGMKIDVEGFEHDVLRGAAELLASRRIGYVQFEHRGLHFGATGSGGDPVALMVDAGAALYRATTDGLLTPSDGSPSDRDLIAVIDHELIDARLLSHRSL